MKTRTGPACSLLVTLLVTAACGATKSAAVTPAAGQQPAAQSAPAPAPPPTRVSLRLDYINAGSAAHAPFYVALERGYYRDAGLDVSIGEGKGSSTTAQVVANGGDTFGLADGGTVMQLIARGLPIKMVSGYMETGANAVIVGAGSTIRSLADLKGKTIGTPAGSGASQLLPAVFAAEHLQGGVRVVSVDSRVAPTALLQHKVDGITMFGFQGPAVLGEQGFQATALPFADAGINVPGVALIAGLDTIQQRPDVVRRFVAATVRGITSMVQDPSGAARIFSSDPSSKMSQAVTLQELQSLVKLMHTRRTATMPIGYIDPQDIADAQQLLERYAKLSPPQPVDHYFTDAFVPQSS